MLCPRQGVGARTATYYLRLVHACLKWTGAVRYDNKTVVYEPDTSK